jgi:O-methyltransferase / aklanonic acid methyltransferase
MDEERVRQMKEMGAGAFSRSAPTYDQVGPRFFAHFGRRLVELADIPAGAAVLDVASGRGAVLFPAAERVGPTGRVIGIELAEGMVKETGEEIRRRGLTNVEIRQMDAEQLDFPDNAFDFVLCGFCLFMFPHRQKTLENFRRVLKPGGRLIASTWGRDDERWAWMGQLLQAHRPPNAPRPPEGPNLFNNAVGLDSVMTEAGFASVKVIDEEVEFTYADAEEWWAVQWSHGGRFMLEMMPPENQQRYKAEAFEKLQAMAQPGGIPHLLPTLFTLATKPVGQ